MSDLGREYTPAEARMIRIFDRLHQRIGAIIMTSAEDAVNKVSDQLGKAKGEIDQVIADLQGQGVQPATLERLQSLSQALDDVVPDQPPAEPNP
jgi:uncharacterized protein YpuA (DUF1002 family)